MYLVEYTKKMENEEKKFFLGYHSRNKAMSSASELLCTSGVMSVTVSCGDYFTTSSPFPSEVLKHA